MRVEGNLVIGENCLRVRDMGRGKGTNNQRRGRHERLPPAESAEEISSSLSSLSMDSNAKSSFPVPLAMWVCHSLANLPKNRTSITATPNGVVARNFQERES